MEDPADRVGGLGLPALGIPKQIRHAAEQMRQARLVGGVEELAVRRPPVSFQHPRKPLAEHRRSIGEPASRRDAVHDNALPGAGPQPGTAATDPPAGLVRCDDRAGLHPSASAV